MADSQAQLAVFQLEAALRDAQSLVGKLRGLLVRARAAATKPTYQPQKRPPGVAYKNATGHLTEAGVAELVRMIEGGMRDSDIARALEITPAAVANRRRLHQAARKAGGSRR